MRHEPRFSKINLLGVCGRPTPFGTVGGSGRTLWPNPHIPPPHLPGRRHPWTEQRYSAGSTAHDWKLQQAIGRESLLDLATEQVAAVEVAAVVQTAVGKSMRMELATVEEAAVGKPTQMAVAAAEAAVAVQLAADQADRNPVADCLFQ